MEENNDSKKPTIKLNKYVCDEFLDFDSPQDFKHAIKALKKLTGSGHDG